MFDIEALFRPYKLDIDNKTFIKEHVPFIICFMFVAYIMKSYKCMKYNTIPNYNILMTSTEKYLLEIILSELIVVKSF